LRPSVARLADTVARFPARDLKVRRLVLASKALSLSDFTVSDVLDFLAGWSVPTATDFARSRRPPRRSQQQ